MQAYLAGLTFALAASPCSTPVLATILAYVATRGDILQGGALLLSYTCGYVVASPCNTVVVVLPFITLEGKVMDEASCMRIDCGSCGVMGCVPVQWQPC